MKKTERLFSPDAWWSVNKYQAKKIGIIPAILLSELIWSRKRFKSDEFFITAKELEDTLGIGEEARRNALKKLSDLGLITITAKGVPKRYFYQINDVRLDEIMADASDEETPTLETEEPRHSEPENPDTIIKKEINKDINNNTDISQEDEIADYTWLTEFFPEFYKTDLQTKSPPRLNFITLEQLAKIGATKDIFRLKCLAYKNDPYRDEKKIPFSPEGLLKAWNFLNIDTPTVPQTTNEKIQSMVDSRPKSERLIAILESFPESTRAILKDHVYIDSDDKVQVTGIPPDQHKTKIKQIIALLS